MSLHPSSLPRGFLLCVRQRCSRETRTCQGVNRTDVRQACQAKDLIIGPSYAGPAVFEVESGRRGFMTDPPPPSDLEPTSALDGCGRGSLVRRQCTGRGRAKCTRTRRDPNLTGVARPAPPRPVQTRGSSLGSSGGADAASTGAGLSPTSTDDTWTSTAARPPSQGKRPPSPCKRKRAFHPPSWPQNPFLPTIPPSLPCLGCVLPLPVRPVSSLSLGPCPVVPL